MTIRSGFFSSLNEDKKYSAKDMSEFVSGIISDGIFTTKGTMFSITPNGTDNTLIIGTGKAWFLGTYLENTVAFPITLNNSDIFMDRYDTIYLDFDSSVEVRDNTIKIAYGVPSADPQKPVMIDNTNHKQVEIGVIHRRANTTSINSGDIDWRVGKDGAPFVTGLVQQATIQEHFARWEYEFEEWFANLKIDLENEVQAFEDWRENEQSKFITWFDHIKGQLSSDAAGNLQIQIDDIYDNKMLVMRYTQVGDNILFVNSSYNNTSYTGSFLSTRLTTEEIRNISIQHDTETYSYKVRCGINDYIKLIQGNTYIFSLDFENSTINFFSGGGINLNYAVVASTVKPTNPVENTIWINSTLPVVDVLFTQQASRSNIQYETATIIYYGSSFGFRALKDSNNNFDISIGDISHHGRPVSSEIYQNGVWYRFTNISENILDDISKNLGTLTNYVKTGDNDLQFYIDRSGIAGDSAQTATHSNFINVTGFNTLTIVAKGGLYSGGVWSNHCVLQIVSSSGGVLSAINLETSPRTYSWNTVGMDYIKINIYSYCPGYKYTSATISDIVLT